MVTHDIVEIGDYVSVMVKGQLDMSAFREITDETFAVCQEKGIRKVIIDVTDAGGPFSEDLKLEFTTYTAHTLRDIVDKYAYIYPKELITYTPQVISEGLDFNLRGFTNLDDALTWIDKD